MYRATATTLLPTSITGSLPRPSWYTENLGERHFLDAMVNAQFREQYTDVEGGARLTNRPVKFGTVTPEVIAFAVTDQHYGSIKERIFAISDALNEKLHDLADAGCPVIQIEEPQIHLLTVRGAVTGEITPKLMIDVFNNTVRGLRAKTEVWCHTCWGNPSQQRMFPRVQSYGPALADLNQVDADVITFEWCASGGIDLEAIGQTITDKKVAVGGIDHHTLQVETAEQVADQLRQALQHIPAERLVVSSDCGMGREGMRRRHAFYKMVSLVQGTNQVRTPLRNAAAAAGRFAWSNPHPLIKPLPRSSGEGVIR